MTRSRLISLLVSGLLAVPLAALLSTTASGAPPSCARAGAGANLWTGADGYWSVSRNWSLGAPPAAGSGQSACIPDDVKVILDVERVDLQRFELGRSSRLTMQERTALYVWGGADQESLTRLDSLIVVDGATLGGGGQLHVIGTVQVVSSQTSTGRLSGGDTDTGLMIVGDDGTLDFRGTSDALLTGGYTVDVHGRARLLESAGLMAEPGTRFRLMEHLADDDEVGRFVIRNDRGYFAPDGADPLSEFVNEGKIVKRFSYLNSAITATYSGNGEVRVRTGYLVLPDEADAAVEVAKGAMVGSGTCAESLTCVTDTTKEDPQFGSLQMPAQHDGFAEVRVKPLDSAKAPARAIGVPMQVHAEELTATAADPVVIELRYNQSLLGSRPSNPDVLTVEHASGTGNYEPVPDCLGAALPPLAFACVDRRAGASRTDGGDVIMVVRTTVTSRWIAD